MKSQSQTIFSFCPTAEVESISGFLIEPSNNLIKLYLVSLQNLVKMVHTQNNTIFSERNGLIFFCVKRTPLVLIGVYLIYSFYKCAY